MVLAKAKENPLTERQLRKGVFFYLCLRSSSYLSSHLQI